MEPDTQNRDAHIAETFYRHPSSRALEEEVRAANEQPPAPTAGASTPPDDTPPPDDPTHARAAELLYGDIFVTSAFDKRAPELFDVLAVGAEQRAALRQQAVEISHVVPEAVAVKILNLTVDAELAAARAPDKSAHAAAVAQRIETANAALRGEFRNKYGAGAEDMLERVRRFARSNPTLSRVLQANGVGSNPEVVFDIASHVFSSGWRG